MKVNKHTIYEIEVDINNKHQVTLDFDDVETDKTVGEFVKESLLYDKVIDQTSTYKITSIKVFKKGIQTFLGKNIPENVLGILYLCDYNYKEETIKVTKEIMYEKGIDALQAYANIPNPESHVVVAKTRKDLLRQVEQLNGLLKSAQYLKELKDYL